MLGKIQHDYVFNVKRCSKESKEPKKVHGPKEKKEQKEETKYTLAFHAEGENNGTVIQLYTFNT